MQNESHGSGIERFLPDACAVFVNITTPSHMRRE